MKVIDILLEAGADPNCESSGYYPLHHAFADPDIILRLLHNGARYSIENAYRPLARALNAKIILKYIGRENLHEDDYTFLLRKSLTERSINPNVLAPYMRDRGYS